MRRNALLLLWLLSDLLMFLGSYALAYFLRVGFIFSSDFPFADYFNVTVLIAPIWLATLIGTRTFALMRRQLSLRTLTYIVYASVMATALFALTYYFLFGLFFSRILLVYALALSTGFTMVWHIVFEQMQRHILRAGQPMYPTLIVGATREAGRLIKTLNQHRSPLTPVAVLDGRGTKETTLEGVPVVGKLNKLEEVLSKHGITHLIQCSDAEQALNLLSACRSHGISYVLLPSVMGIVEGDERIESIEGNQVTVVRPPEGGWTWFFR